MLPDQLMQALLAFRAERAWEPFHTPKNLAIAITVEAAELLEEFRWSRDADPVPVTDNLRHEIADVTILLAYLAHDLGIDIDAAVREKLAINAERYPVDRSRGVSGRPSPASH
ncbi:MAG: nucleotide pyrophosphohydrolase [Gemmatimonadales bacterium]|nr:nucleotide pyrophosphohydrolase [Gemmatimonadales bacterium]